MSAASTSSSLTKPAVLVHWLPAFSWLSSNHREWLRFDLVAGLTTAAVVIPKAMAYAAIAGLPLEVGLYTSLIPLVVYAVLAPNSEVLKVVEHSGLGKRLGQERMLFTLEQAVGQYRKGVGDPPRVEPT